MAKIYADGAGELIRFLQSDDEEAQWGAPPAFAEMLEFDGESNPAVLHGINADWNSHRLQGGVLMRNGLPVTIVPDSALIAERKRLAAIRQDLAAYITDASLDAYLANASPSQAQNLMTIKATARSLRLLIRLIVLLMDYYLKRGLRP
jgi:hypothetical protein